MALRLLRVARVQPGLCPSGRVQYSQGEKKGVLSDCTFAVYYQSWLNDCRIDAKWSNDIVIVSIALKYKWGYILSVFVWSNSSVDSFFVGIFIILFLFIHVSTILVFVLQKQMLIILVFVLIIVTKIALGGSRKPPHPNLSSWSRRMSLNFVVKLTRLKRKTFIYRMILHAVVLSQCIRVTDDDRRRTTKSISWVYPNFVVPLPRSAKM